MKLIIIIVIIIKEEKIKKKQEEREKKHTETDVKEGEENIKQEKFLALTAETGKEKGERSLFSSS